MKILSLAEAELPEEWARFGKKRQEAASSLGAEDRAEAIERRRYFILRA